jgi:hypothetical protein
MANLIKAKQIDRILSAPIRLSSFSASAANTDDITTDLTTALSTAGDGGVSVPLQVSTVISMLGVITSGANNRVEIWDSASKLKLIDASGNEVYGRITELGGAYSLKYYTIIAGVETARTFPSALTIDFTVNYRFDLKRYPTDAGTMIGGKNVSDDPSSGSNGRAFGEKLTVTALNTVSNLAFLPSVGSAIQFAVNGQVFQPVAGSPISYVGKVGTWNAANAFDLETTDVVVVTYFTFE